MGLATLASTLYSIQSRKNVPLKTAFSMMIREDMATRFSVFNLTKYITKSEFMATLAHAKFGKLTPIQKAEKQQKDKEIAAENKRQQKLEKFQRFTVSSISAMNSKINLIAAITEKNTGLINSLYSDLGYFKNQRKININSINPKSIRVPLREKTVKGQIEAINKKIEELKQVKAKPIKAAKTAVDKKKKKEEIKQSGLLDSVFSSIMSNPLVMMSLARGAIKAIGITALATEIISVLNLPKTVGDIVTRMSGTPAYGDDLKEQYNQAVTPAMGAIGAYGAVQGTVAIARYIKNRIKTKTPNYQAKARIQTLNKATKGFQSRGMSYKEAQKLAGARYSKITKVSKYLKKWTKLNKLFGGLAKKIPGLAAADVVFELARISNCVAEHSVGRMTDKEFKEKVSHSLTEITSTVGFTALGSIVGAVAGSGIFPGVGSLMGGLIGAGAGMIGSVLVPEERMETVGATLFNLLFEDNASSIKKPKTETPQTQQPNRPAAPAAPQGAAQPQGTPLISSGLTGDTRIQERTQNDPDFMKEVQRVSDKFQIDPADLLAVMWRESRLLPDIDNPTTKATGLIQFMPDTAKSLGTSTDALKKMTRAQQMVYVEKYFDMVGLPKGSNSGQIYSYVFLPGIAKKSGNGILASRNDPATAKYYNANQGLDANRDGIITVDDLSIAAGKVPTAVMLAETRPSTVVQPPPVEQAAPEKTADNKSDKAHINSVAALQSAARIQGQLNAVSTETIKIREKVKAQDEFPTTHNADMQQYA